jgi:hypothetical protein
MGGIKVVVRLRVDIGYMTKRVDADLQSLKRYSAIYRVLRLSVHGFCSLGTRSCLPEDKTAELPDDPTFRNRG